jgi:hypothetical protein
MIRETNFGVAKHDIMRNFSLSMLEKCLRRAATPRRAATQGRCIPVGSRHLRCGRPLIENVSIGGRRHTAVKQHASNKK